LTAIRSHTKSPTLREDPIDQWVDGVRRANLRIQSEHLSASVHEPRNDCLTNAMEPHGLVAERLKFT
jgi:hypothetical protein